MVRLHYLCHKVKVRVTICPIKEYDCLKIISSWKQYLINLIHDFHQQLHMPQNVGAAKGFSLQKVALDKPFTKPWYNLDYQFHLCKFLTTIFPMLQWSPYSCKKHSPMNVLLHKLDFICFFNQRKKTSVSHNHLNPKLCASMETRTS